MGPRKGDDKFVLVPVRRNEVNKTNTPRVSTDKALRVKLTELVTKIVSNYTPYAQTSANHPDTFKGTILAEVQLVAMVMAWDDFVTLLARGIRQLSELDALKDMKREIASVLQLIKNRRDMIFEDLAPQDQATCKKAFAEVHMKPINGAEILAQLFGT